jgi:hypothetical protein
MIKLAFIHRGSKTCKLVIEETGIPRYRRGVRPEVVVNYGVAGERMERWRRLNPYGDTLPMVNRDLSVDKFRAVLKAQEMGVRCPESRQSLEREHELDKWLEKPFYSQGGRGIQIAVGRYHYHKYFQEFIRDRVYELRVHTFKWIPRETWVVQKRVGEPDQVTWNHKTGGRFITVNDTSQRVFQEAIENSAKVLEILKMGFGAVDFIVDEGRRVYFIEVNSAPGVNGLSEGIYVEAFEGLKEMEKEKVSEYVS